MEITKHHKGGRVTKHKIFVSGKVAVIEVYNSTFERYFYVIVDTVDLDLIVSNVETLSVGKDYNTFYCLYRKNKKTSSIHRLIMNTPDKLVVDHINHNGLDNRKVNLRNCTSKENAKNRRGGVRDPIIMALNKSAERRYQYLQL